MATITRMQFSREVLQLRAPKLNTLRNKVYWAERKLHQHWGCEFITDGNIFTRSFSVKFKEALYNFVPDAEPDNVYCVGVFVTESIFCAN